MGLLIYLPILVSVRLVIASESISLCRLQNENVDKSQYVSEVRVKKTYSQVTTGLKGAKGCNGQKGEKGYLGNKGDNGDPGEVDQAELETLKNQLLDTSNNLMNMSELLNQNILEAIKGAEAHLGFLATINRDLTKTLNEFDFEEYAGCTSKCLYYYGVCTLVNPDDFHCKCNETSAACEKDLPFKYWPLEDGWGTVLYDYEYQLTNVSASWNDSRTTCQQWGGDLAVYGILNKVTRKLLQNQFKSVYNDTTWIGLRDQTSKGNWVWVNNQTEYRENFEASTDEVNPKDCGEINWRKGVHLGVVYDSECHVQQHALCERKI